MRAAHVSTSVAIRLLRLARTLTRPTPEALERIDAAILDLQLAQEHPEVRAELHARPPTSAP
jgi:hypothetical protein